MSRRSIVLAAYIENGFWGLHEATRNGIDGRMMARGESRDGPSEALQDAINKAVEILSPTGGTIWIQNPRPGGFTYLKRINVAKGVAPPVTRL